MPPILLALIVLVVVFVILATVVIVGALRTTRAGRLLGEVVLDIPPPNGLPSTVAREVDVVDHALEICGLSIEVAAGRVVSTDTGAHGWFRTWVDEAGTTRCTALTALDPEKPTAAVSTVAFLSWAVLGGELRALETSDTPLPMPWPMPEHQLVRCMGASPETLWHIHRARIDTLPPGSLRQQARTLPEEVRFTHQRLIDEGLRRGFVVRDPDGAVAFTPKGAWQAVRAHLPPWSTRRDARDRRASDHWLASL